MTPPTTIAPAPARSGAWRSIAWPAAGIAALLAVNAAFDASRVGLARIFSPGSFLHVSLRDGVPNGAAIDVLNHGSRFAILALGMTPVIATRGVDLSVGAIMAVSGALAATIVHDGGSSWLALLAALGIGLACGLWNGLLVAGLRIQPFVATLVLMVAGRGIAQMITHGQTVTFSDDLLVYIGNARPPWLPLPFPFLIALVLLALTALSLRRTAAGLLLEATGANPEAARLTGVRSRSITAAAYAFSGLCAGLAGVVVTGNLKAADPFHTGVNAELAAIFAVVVGGTSLAGGRFSLLGAFIGAFLLQALTTTMYARNVSADVAPFPSALVILAVCLLSAPAFRRRFVRRKRP